MKQRNFVAKHMHTFNKGGVHSKKNLTQNKREAILESLDNTKEKQIMKIDNKVYFRHERNLEVVKTVYCDSMGYLDLYSPHNLGGKTIAIELVTYPHQPNEVLVFVGVAVCSDEDNFSRYKGRTLAQSRLYNDLPIVFSVKEIEKMGVQEVIDEAYTRYIKRKADEIKEKKNV